MSDGRRPGRPTRGEAEILHGRLFDEAYAAFCSDGFAAASIEGIASACGIGKNTIYRRFPDKQALFKAVIEREIGAYERILERLAESVEDPLEAVRLAARQITIFSRAPQSLQILRLLISENIRFPDLAQQLDHWFDAVYCRLDHLLSAAMECGAIAKRPVRPLREALIMLVAVPSLDQLILRDRAPEMSDAVFAQRWLLFLNGAAEG